MLHILLLILKIIGIVLLVILGALLLGIACALFVPVRYRIEAVRQEGEGEPPARIRVKVTWMLHLINFLLRFDGAVFVRARILVFTIFRIPKKEKRRKKTKKEKDSGKRDKQEKQEKTASPIDKAEEEPPAETTLKDDELQERLERAEAIMQQTAAKNEAGEASAGVQEKPDFWDKLHAIPEIVRKLYEKIKGFFENIQYTIKRFCDKIGSISDTIEYYREVVEGETFKRSFALCKGELLSIAKSLRPRKLEVSLIIGMDDPASTGEILAVCGMLYPIIGGHVDVRGDFEKKRLEGQALIVGKLRMVTFLKTAVRIYFNKDIRKLYKLLKKEAVNG